MINVLNSKYVFNISQCDELHLISALSAPTCAANREYSPTSELPSLKDFRDSVGSDLDLRIMDTFLFWYIFLTYF